MTQDEFVKLLSTYNGNIELSTSIKLKMNKGGRGNVAPNPFYDKDVRKVKTATYEIGANYRKKIAEALVAEGLSAEKSNDFGDTLPWGEYEIKDKVINYNGKRYLRCYPVKDSKSVEEIFIDNNIPSPEDLKIITSYIPSKSSSKKQEDAGITEEHKVIPLLFAFDNIIYAIIDGKKYDIE